MKARLQRQIRLDLRTATVERWVSVACAGVALLFAIVAFATNGVVYESWATVFATMSAVVLIASWIARRPSRQLTVFAAALDATRDMVFLIDPVSMKFIHVNSSACDTLGFNQSEFLGMTPPDICVGRSLEDVEKIFDSARDDPKGCGSLQSTYRARDGRLIQVDVRLGFLDRVGSHGLYIAVGRDKTEEYEAIEQLRRSEDLLERTQTISGVGSWEYDLEHGTLYWSRQTRVIHEVPEEYEPQLETALGYYCEDHRANIETAVQECVDSGKAYDLELELVTAKGRTIWVRTMGSPTLVDGRVVRISGTIEDITEKIRVHAELEEALRLAEEASRAKSEFLANMSHEIRTPLTAIIGFSDLLLDPDLGSAQRENYLGTIRRNGEHLAAVINDILDMSKIEAGKMTVELRPMRVSEVVSDAIELLSPQACKKGNALACSIEDTVPEWITSDPVRVRQILINLLTNAIKFTERGSVALLVQYDEQQSRLMCRVTDTGIGMDRATIDKLFEAFTQADSSITRRYGGTGLGLRISRSLAMLLGGTIEVESRPGVGSTFTLTIRAKRAVPEKHNPADPSVSSVSMATPSLVGTRILIAEDGVDNQRLIRHFLNKAGAQTHIANNGLDALDAVDKAAVKGEPFDLIVMDMQMPEMDGHTATRELRSRGVMTPVLALTAHATQEARESSIKAGCDGFATKPIDRSNLIATCLELLKERPSKAA